MSQQSKKLTEKEEIYLIRLYHTKLIKRKEKDIGSLNEFISNIGYTSDIKLRNFMKECINEGIFEDHFNINAIKVYRLNRKKLVKKLNNEGKVFNNVMAMIYDNSVLISRKLTLRELE